MKYDFGFDSASTCRAFDGHRHLLTRLRTELVASLSSPFSPAQLRFTRYAPLRRLFLPLLIRPILLFQAAVVSASSVIFLTFRAPFHRFTSPMRSLCHQISDRASLYRLLHLATALTFTFTLTPAARGFSP